MAFCSNLHGTARRGFGQHIASLFDAIHRMAKASITAHWPTTASAADFFDGSKQPKERTLIDVCRTPFAFGLATLVPVALIVGALVLLVQLRPMFAQRLSTLTVHGQAR